MNYKFPPHFLWGHATSSYQIEGAHDVDGRRPSIWDTFCDTPGKIEDKSHGQIACDHYNRWTEDLDLIKSLNAQAYRFSIAWPRVIPSGTGPVNSKGLGFYDQLVDGLLDRGIEPCVTLYHWDLPQILQDQGGWVERNIVEAFNEYTHAVSQKLGDRVKLWITHNEPWCASVLGYENGEHAPGHKDVLLAMRAAHHLLLSHGTATEIIRSNVANAHVGITVNLCPAYSASQSEADKKATQFFDGTFNRWFMDPLYKGTYPQDVIEERFRLGQLKEPALDYVHEGDLEKIKTPTDFIGINYYSRAIIRDNNISEEENEPRELFDPPKEELTEMGWEVYPPGLYDLMMRVHHDYAPKAIYITENGAAFKDSVNEDGQIEDTKRIKYFQDHLSELHKAIVDKVPIQGYFAWSFMDNFEWAFGYTKRFGIVRVDYDTQKRTVKNSGKWLKTVYDQNGF